MKTVRELLIEALEKGGYDGLVQEDRECACDIHDLIPCDEACHRCEPGWKIADKTGEYDYLITTKKPKL